MASIIKASINLSEIPKDKIYVGKKGKYLPITITLNDDVDQFGNQGPVVVEQTKEERVAKQAKTYLGNVKVIWTYGENVATAPRDNQPAAEPAPAKEADLPFWIFLTVVIFIIWFSLPKADNTSPLKIFRKRALASPVARF